MSFLWPLVMGLSGWQLVHADRGARHRQFYVSLQTMGRRVSTRGHASSAALPSGTDTVKAEDLGLWVRDHAEKGARRGSIERTGPVAASSQRISGSAPCGTAPSRL